MKARVSKVTDLTLTQLRNPQALAMNEGVSRFLHTGFTPRVSLQHFKDVVITLIYSGTIYIDIDDTRCSTLPEKLEPVTLR